MLDWLQFSFPPSPFTVLCVITERGRWMGETDRLCFERFARLQLCDKCKFKYGLKSTWSPSTLCIIPYVTTCVHVFLCVDTSGVIPEDEDEEQEMYDDIGPTVPRPTSADSEPIDDDIYEELPGQPFHTPWTELSLYTLSSLSYILDRECYHYIFYLDPHKHRTFGDMCTYYSCGFQRLGQDPKFSHHG